MSSILGILTIPLKTNRRNWVWDLKINCFPYIISFPSTKPTSLVMALRLVTQNWVISVCILHLTYTHQHGIQWFGKSPLVLSCGCFLCFCLAPKLGWENSILSPRKGEILKCSLNTLCIWYMYIIFYVFFVALFWERCYFAVYIHVHPCISLSHARSYCSVWGQNQKPGRADRSFWPPSASKWITSL